MRRAATRWRAFPAAAALAAALALACGQTEGEAGSDAPAGAEAPEQEIPGSTQQDEKPAPEDQELAAPVARLPSEPPPAVAPAPPAPAPAPPGEEPPAEPTAAPEGQPEPGAIDLEELELRLKETRAVGVLTKLALRDDIDDLLAAVGAYHERGQGTLDALHERFGLLVMKVMSLVQEKDPDLADALARSRDRLWQLLADPQEFARLGT